MSSNNREIEDVVLLASLIEIAYEDADSHNSANGAPEGAYALRYL